MPWPQLAVYLGQAAVRDGLHFRPARVSDYMREDLPFATGKPRSTGSPNGEGRLHTPQKARPRGLGAGGASKRAQKGLVRVVGVRPVCTDNAVNDPLFRALFRAVAPTFFLQTASRLHLRNRGPTHEDRLKRQSRSVIPPAIRRIRNYDFVDCLLEICRPRDFAWVESESNKETHRRNDVTVRRYGVSTCVIALQRGLTTLQWRYRPEAVTRNTFHSSSASRASTSGSESRSGSVRRPANLWSKRTSEHLIFVVIDLSYSWPRPTASVRSREGADPDLKDLLIEPTSAPKVRHALG